MSEAALAAPAWATFTPPGAAALATDLPLGAYSPTRDVGLIEPLALAKTSKAPLVVKVEALVGVLVDAEVPTEAEISRVNSTREPLKPIALGPPESVAPDMTQRSLVSVASTLRVPVVPAFTEITSGKLAEISCARVSCFLGELPCSPMSKTAKLPSMPKWELLPPA